jgi:hypothetical protein
MRELRFLATRELILSESIEMQLRTAGWSADRRVDHAAADSALNAEGYATWAGLQEFLREFSGLVISAKQTGRSVWFDAEKAVQDVDPAWPRAYAEIVGSSMVPVGGYSHMTIYMGRDGRLYGGFDNEFGCLGSNAIEALDGVLNGDMPTKLDMRVPD